MDELEEFTVTLEVNSDDDGSKYLLIIRRDGWISGAGEDDARQGCRKATC